MQKHRIEGRTAFIELTPGIEVALDKEDFDALKCHFWRLHAYQSGHCYAISTIGGKRFLMHRLIMSPPERCPIDHMDGDGLNNRRKNLRVCSHAENMRNKIVQRRNRLGLTGVACKNGKYNASIRTDNRTIHLGTYATADEAAAAYRGAAKALWGEFAPKA